MRRRKKDEQKQYNKKLQYLESSVAAFQRTKDRQRSRTKALDAVLEESPREPGLEGGPSNSRCNSGIHRSQTPRSNASYLSMQSNHATSCAVYRCRFGTFFYEGKYSRQYLTCIMLGLPAIDQGLAPTRHLSPIPLNASTRKPNKHIVTEVGCHGQEIGIQRKRDTMYYIFLAAVVTLHSTQQIIDRHSPTLRTVLAMLTLGFR